MNSSDSTPKTSAASGPATSGSQKNSKKKPSFKETARAQFSKPSTVMSVDSFFSDFSSVKRNNISVKVDDTVVDRVLETYLPRLRQYCELTRVTAPNTLNLVRDCELLLMFGLFRKLVLAAPTSQLDLDMFSFVKRIELWLPPAYISVIDNFGKLEFDDFVVRIKYNQLVIFQLAVRIVKIWSLYIARGVAYPQTWVARLATVNNYKRVLTDNQASVDYLIDQAKDFLEEQYQVNHPFTDAQGVVLFHYSYPHLSMSKDYDTQVQNVKTWLTLVNGNMPNIDVMLAAVFSTIFRVEWFASRMERLRVRDPTFPAWLNITPDDIIDGAGYVFVLSGVHDGYSIAKIASEALAYVSECVQASLSPILLFEKQPNNEFGSKAQLVQVDEDQFYEKASKGYPNHRILEISDHAFGRSLFKFKEKDSVVMALLFGFTTDVKYENIYHSRLNTNSVNTKALYLAKDIRKF